MQSDQTWAQAVETLAIIVWTAKPDGSVEYVNRRWIESTGLSAAEIADALWIRILHPDDVTPAMTTYERAIAQETPFGVDVRVRMGDGTYRWMRVQSEPMREAGGAIVRWLGVMIDVDEAHRAQERFRVLSEAIPVIVWSSDPDGWVDWYNGRWYAYTGQTPEEARGWGWQAAHHPDDFTEVMRRWPQSIETGEPFEMEFRLRRHDGLFHWFLTRIEPLRDERGTVVRWYGSNIDIDAQKTALERSKRIAETLQDVFLPKDLPQYGDMRIDAAYIAAERDALVGGDWYDAFELPDGRLAFSMGDVAGHGLDASVLVGRLRQAIYTLAFKGEDPAQILSDTNHILHHQNPETFVTAIVGFVNTAHDCVIYANAGHPPPLVANEREATARILPTGDPPLGVSAQTHYSNAELTILPESLVLLYTDGMTEFSRAIEVVEEKLKAAAALVVRDRSVVHPARAIQDLVLDQSATTDDAALLVLHFSTFAAGMPARNDAPKERSWRFHSSDAYSAHASRREVMSYLRRFCTEAADVFTTELIAGELLANTVEHAPGLVEIQITWQGDRPVMTVRDSGPGMHRIRHELPEDPLDENGRGLFLVKRLADDCRVKASPGFGTEVRVTLPLRKNAANPAGTPDSTL
ncbi:MAG TPA: SpoIIE family protein phosphatase [Candidatus Baltobacteraceae bacterium]|jgi:PAS domain S-box-containing protein